MEKRKVAVLISGILLLAPLFARAYTPTVTPNGVPVRWKMPVKLQFAGNPVNKSGIDESQFYTAVVHGLQRWASASSGSVGFDYWQGRDPVVYEPNSHFNGLSSIYFASNSKDTEGLSPSVLGLTQVWYDTHSGQIFETDVVLNDNDFKFTVNEQDTSGYGSGNIPSFGSRNKVFIENVITHELGHALGLSHSGGLQSTMLFMESPEQAHLGCDDQVAIHAIYPSDDANQRGTNKGSDRTEGGSGVFGAHVLAISRARGTVLATAMTDREGSYLFSAMEPGTYYLMVEPFYAGPSTLPAYYSNINAAVCADGKPFGRSLLTDSSGYRLQPIEVSAGGAVHAPPLIARCNGTSGASVSSIASLSRGLNTALLYDGLTQSGGFGFTDKLSASSAQYPLKMLSGNVEIHALAYSLYSPVHPTLELDDEFGNPVDAQVLDRAYESDSGYVNYDSYLRASDLKPGDYTLKVFSSPLDASLYPAGPISLDSQPFVVVTGRIDGREPRFASTIATNVRCRAAENFAEYTSPPGPPPRHSTATEDKGGGIGFCGSILFYSNHDPGGGPPGPSRPSCLSSRGASAGALAGWFLPWVLMALMARFASKIGRLAPLAYGVRRD
jgi:hypothetical protein